VKQIEALFQPAVSARALEDGALALGRLAGWWMTESAFARLPGEFPRQCTLRAGEFVVLLERTVPSAVISEGLALPMRWIEAPAHDARLPAGLRALAERVATASDGVGPRRLSLALGDDCPDLSKLRLGPESAGAMLAATLEIARLGAQPDPFVTASAEWMGAESLRTVDGLGAKCAAAARLGLRALWVAPTQDLGSLDMSAIKVAIKVAQLPESSGSDQLNALIGELDARPNASSLDAACAWYHRNRNRKGPKAGEARDFYCSELAPRLATNARACAGVGQLPTQLDALVVVATGAPSVAFAAAYLRPKRVFVVYLMDSTGTDYRDQTVASVQKVSAAIEVLPIALPAPSTSDYAALRDATLERLRAVVDQGDAAVDLTGGTTLLKLALFEATQALRLHRAVVDGSETSHAKGGHDVTTLRVVSIPHGAI
jgi:hypothetical protein